MQKNVHPDRLRRLNDAAVGDGPVLYWMRRDQRSADNWALRRAGELAAERGTSLGVGFCLAPEFLGASRRQYRFLLEGLSACAGELARLRIPFYLLTGDPAVEIPALARRVGAGIVVADYSPMRLLRGWTDAAAAALTVACEEVDAHNVVPVWRVSAKQEYAARTIRPKLHRLLPEFLVEPPGAPAANPAAWTAEVAVTDWKRAAAFPRTTDAGPDHDLFPPGPMAAAAALDIFLRERLSSYDRGRNDAGRDGQSDLSPYLHFGQLSAQRVAWEAMQSRAPDADRDAYIEELIVRRELSDNYCHYCPDYDGYAGLPAWARRTLEEHADDPREFLYTAEEFETAETHDALWNAAQRELVVRGKMHGYLRMYWAKMILAWSPDPESALHTAIDLNDRYSLDGRDPNGYVGCAWSVGGLHDRPWPRRPVFGTVRSMSLGGCKRKFRVERYIDRIARLAREVGA